MQTALRDLSFSKKSTATETISAFQEAPVWRPIAHSLQGPSHAKDDRPCQDSHTVRLFGEDGNQTLIACVADGAGSAKHSDVGSAIASRAIVERAGAFLEAGGQLPHLERQDVLRWCEDVRRQIEEESAKWDCDARELATTICAALLSTDFACFFQIGDGAIVVRRNGIYGVVFWPQSGEYANSTNFLTSPLFGDHLEFVSTDAVCSDIALMTDGLERLALRFDSQTPHIPFFEPFFRAIRAAEDFTGLNAALESFLASAPVRERSDDDKTLVLASFINHEAENAV